MKIKKIKNSDCAVVGIVAAFLIIGLIVAVISVIQTQYVPKWMEEKEAAHMDELADQFARLKYAIDIHSAISTEQQGDAPPAPISTSVTLGSKEMPYLMSVRAFGQLEILEEGCNVAINGTTSCSYPIGTIKYSSSNAYFINQDYIYECGAVLLSQHQGNTVFMKPSIFVEYGENVTITFRIVNISTIGGKKMIAGYGTYPIQTEFLSPEPRKASTSIDNASNITIDTKYVNAWHSFINSTLLKSGFSPDDYGANYSIDADANNEKVVVYFNTSDITVNVKAYYIKIGAQIAPGWIE